MAGPVDPNRILNSEGSGVGSILGEDKVRHVASLDIQKEELQALAKFKLQLEFVKNNKISYLVLGDFSEHPKRRLNLVCQQLNGKSDTAAKTLIKLPYFEELDDVSTEAAQSNLETYLKFQSVARIVTAIVFVSEGRNAGSSVELGHLTPNGGNPDNHPFFAKTNLAVRDYSDLSEQKMSSDHPSYDDVFSTSSDGEPEMTTPRPYSSPQESKFEIFEREGRCWTWDTRKSLWEVADEIHEVVQGP